MDGILEYISQPWPWYIAGPLIGLTVPVLLLFGNKYFGISAALRHICAACFPFGIPALNYDWKQESWNLVFVSGILIGGFLGAYFLSDPAGVQVADSTKADLEALGLLVDTELMPAQIFSWENVWTPTGLVFIIMGGFLVGFGTRWAGGCTSGHAIFGLSNLQWPSLVATCCFMAGGFIMTLLIFPGLIRLLGF